MQIFKFCNSNGEVRRLIRGNGIKVNDKLVDDEKFILKKEDQEDPIKISIGKKKHGLVIFK